MENDPRVREFVAKIKPDVASVGEFGTLNFMEKGEWQIFFDQAAGVTANYYVPGWIQWENFPEIKRADEVFQNDLFIGSAAGCVVDKNSGATYYHSYNRARFDYPKKGQWSMMVGVTCNNDWRIAYVDINPDGSYEGLRLE